MKLNNNIRITAQLSDDFPGLGKLGIIILCLKIFKFCLLSFFYKNKKIVLVFDITYQVMKQV